MEALACWTTSDLNKEHWKKWQPFKKRQNVRQVTFQKRKGFLIHKGKHARQFSPIHFDGLRLCRWLFPSGRRYLSFCSMKSSCWCFNCHVAHALSDIDINLFPILPPQSPLRNLSYEKTGCLLHRLINPGWSGREEPELSRHKKNLLFHKVLLAFNWQETISSWTNLYFDIHMLNNLLAHISRSTATVKKPKQHEGSHSQRRQSNIFTFLHTNGWIKRLEYSWNPVIKF